MHQKKAIYAKFDLFLSQSICFYRSTECIKNRITLAPVSFVSQEIPKLKEHDIVAVSVSSQSLIHLATRKQQINGINIV